ncbi:MAG TPA: rod shape-determining protein MreC [Gaiellaceae bacterium]|nr:rod shape-determining protein MreC [Gaiellaceae bacterium]
MKRRIVVGVLVLLSLVLITVSFRSSALDGVQGTAAGILQPFEVAADRVTRPFRDAAGWVRGLADAKSENKKLRAENEKLRQQLILDESAVQENVQLKSALNYQGPASIADFHQVHTSVSVNPQSVLDQSVEIAAGSTSGLQVGNVVVATSGGLVGTVSRVTPKVSKVTLLTDDQSNVTATDLTSPTAVGIVHSGGSQSSLILDRVSKTKVVNVGDSIITAGTLGAGSLKSMFPRGILIGSVTSQSNNDINAFKTIQIQPLVDFTSLQSVIVLVPNK